MPRLRGRSFQPGGRSFKLLWVHWVSLRPRVLRLRVTVWVGHAWDRGRCRHVLTEHHVRSLSAMDGSLQYQQRHGFVNLCILWPQVLMCVGFQILCLHCFHSILVHSLPLSCICLRIWQGMTNQVRAENTEASLERPIGFAVSS